MDDFRLRVFITAAKTLNFTKCAEQLFISQPAVSKHIGELESRYKVQLFERSGSRLALTEAGRVMLEHAERIADGYRRLQYEMDLFTDRLGGELKVGASTTIAQYVLPQVLARFTARFPEVKVSLASGNSEQVEAALARHDTDLGLVESSARHPGFHYEPFIPDELVLIASTKGRYGRCDQVTLAELQTVPQFRTLRPRSGPSLFLSWKEGVIPLEYNQVIMETARRSKVFGLFYGDRMLPTRARSRRAMRPR